MKKCSRSLGLCHNHCRDGFTLVEMIVVIAIMMIMTGVIMANLPAFRSKTELDLVAQEVAITIRQAQVYGLNAKSVSATGEFPAYGIDFNISHDSYMILFADKDKNSVFDGNLCGTASECRERFDFRRGIKIKKITITCPSGDTICDSAASSPSPLNIVFTQPDLEPHFAIGENTASNNQSITALKATIEIAKESDPADSRKIIIENTGFVYVKKL